MPLEFTKEKQNCFGCTACKNICPKQAILMNEDEEGFMYPLIDKFRCIKCGMCDLVCPVNNEFDIDRLNRPIVYAFKHKNDSVRMESTSGGAYTAISDFILKKNKQNCASNKTKIEKLESYDNKNIHSINPIKNVCYGVEFDCNFEVSHKVATNIDERNKFRGSKYVQSNLESTFRNVKEDLIDGKTVLFTGTPCQTAGLLNFLKLLKIDTSKLILNDIICTGVQSPKLWNEFVKFIETKYNSKIKSFKFRNKEDGWNEYSVRVEFENGKIKKDTVQLKVFTKLFFSFLALRPSCYNCKFSTQKRFSDITFGDYWGIEKVLPGFEDEKGVSLIIINTLKGEELFEQIKAFSYYEKSNIQECTMYQHSLNSPVHYPQNRPMFWNKYCAEGFYGIAREYGGYNFWGSIRILVIKFLKQIRLFKLLKSILKN